jgi:SOS regulatory protein LexA
MFQKYQKGVWINMYGIRLKQLRKQKGLTQEELAKRIGISRGRLNNYEREYREPDFEMLTKFAEFFEVTTDYILGKTDDPWGTYNETLSAALGQAIDGDKLAKIPKELTPITNIIRIPVLGSIAAGKPILAEENIIDWEYIPNPGNYKEGELFSLIVKGDSMIGSRIYDGDKVIVRVQPTVEDGEIAVVKVDGEHATLKRVKRINGKVLLFADNPKYEPIVIASEQARICGKVIQVIFDPTKKL